MAGVLEELEDAVTPERLLISIAAGLPVRFYESRLPPSTPFIRAMPTFFGQIKMGTTGLSLNKETTADHLALASRLFGTVSENVIVLPESEMDAFTTFGSTTTAAVYMLRAASPGVARPGHRAGGGSGSKRGSNAEAPGSAD
jgi:pyrroline-5-carboxylate reductase